MSEIKGSPYAPQASDATQKRRTAQIIDFPTRGRRPEGPVSRDGLQWYVDHPKEAAEDGIKPWQLEIIANRLHILAQLDEEDRRNPPPVPPPVTDADITRMLLDHPDPKWREAGRTGKWKRVPSDAVRRDDLRDDDEAPAKGQRLPFHPAADKFPLMSKAELEALAADIEAHGLNEAIETLDDGDGPMVLDGRNRYNACLMIGFDLTNHIRVLSDNTNPADHLISKNLMRRHQTKLERALFAARLVTSAHGGNRKSEIKTSKCGVDIVTLDEAARRIGVSKAAVERASYILRNGADEFIAAIDAGIPWLTLGYADKIAHSDEEDQHLWLKDNRHAIKPVKRGPRLPKPPIPFTADALKALSDPAARVIVDKLMPKANRDLALQGEQWVRVKLTEGEEP